MKLSKDAKTALLAAKNRPGARVITTSQATDAHLKQEGLITAGGNLTAKGHIQRINLARQAEDEAFG